MPVDATLTDVLLAPAAAGVEPEGWARVRDRLVAGLVDAAAGRGGDVDVEVGVRQLRRARYRPELLGLPEEPFAWKPAFVRRSLGHRRGAGLRRGAVPGAGGGGRPAGRRGGRGVAALRLAHLPLGAVVRRARGRRPAPVLADAVTWATPVWAAFDWAAPGPLRRAGWAGRPVVGAGPGAGPPAGPVGGPRRPRSGSARRRRRGDGAGVGLGRPIRATDSARSWPSWPWSPDWRRRPGRPRHGWSGLWPEAGRGAGGRDRRVGPGRRRRPGGGHRGGHGRCRRGRSDDGGGLIRTWRPGHPERRAPRPVRPGSGAGQKRALAALASGLPAAVRGISSTTRSWRGTL